MTPGIGYYTGKLFFSSIIDQFKYNDTEKTITLLLSTKYLSTLQLYCLNYFKTLYSQGAVQFSHRESCMWLFSLVTLVAMRTRTLLWQLLQIVYVQLRYPHSSHQYSTTALEFCAGQDPRLLFLWKVALQQNRTKWNVKNKMKYVSKVPFLIKKEKLVNFAIFRVLMFFFNKVHLDE